MRRIKTLIASGVITALAVSALAAPASAATKGHATIVNGIPGTKIDVCIGKKEIRSKLKYGEFFKKRLVGKNQFKFRQASPGACKGKLLTSRTVKFPSGADKTIVITKKSPYRVLVWDNSQLGTQLSADPVGALALRHAADLTDNSVHFLSRSFLWDSDYVYDVSATTDFTKGDQRLARTVDSADEYVFRIKVTRSINENNVLAKSPIFEVEPLKRFEFIFMGTSKGNAKVVMVTSSLSAAPPAP